MAPGITASAERRGRERKLMGGFDSQRAIRCCVIHGGAASRDRIRLDFRLCFRLRSPPEIIQYHRTYHYLAIACLEGVSIRILNTIYGWIRGRDVIYSYAGMA